jgi:hypothetical protein
VHRPVVAQRMAEEYGSEPADRQRNVIHDIPVFIGRVSKLIEAMTSGERKLKEGKHQGGILRRALPATSAAAPAAPAPGRAVSIHEHYRW